MVTSVLALDVGTSMVKAVVVASGGKVVREASIPVEPDGQPGVDTRAMWAVVQATIAEAVAGLGAFEAPDAVIISAQGDGLWMVDSSGTPLERAYLWNSSEGADAIARWDAEGVIEEHFRSTGTVLWPGSLAALWSWWRQAHPERVGFVQSVMCAKDFVAYQLTGVICTDLTDASIPFLDLKSGRYDPQAFSRLDCDDLQDRVAPIGVAGDVLGEVTRPASEVTGLAPGTPVYLGALDVAAMLWGQGLGSPGDVLAILGTTALSASITDTLDFAGGPAGATLSVGEGQYLRAMGSSAGAATLEWFLSTMGYRGDARYDQMWADVETAPDGREVFLPYLSGERAPILAPYATGSFHGLTHQTTRGAMARAVTEGIAMAMCRGIDRVLGSAGNSGQIVLTGGGAQATPWAHQVANITGRSVAIDQRPHVGALGVAGLLIDTATDSDRVVIGPNDRSDALGARYQDFIDLTDTLTPWWAAHPGTN